MSRHLWGYDPGDPEYASFAIGRLLEDGDGVELRRLAALRGEGPLVAWFQERGGRQLSRRSRCFWSWVLDREPVHPVPLAEELWPL